LKSRAQTNSRKLTRSGTDLIRAIELRDFKLAQTLLEAGASPNAADEHGTPALNRALYGTSKAKEGDEGIATLLLEVGAEPDKPDSTGTTPIMLATKNGFERVVNLLLKKGVNVNARPKRGVLTYAGSALCIAAAGGHRKLVWALIAAGADVNQPSSRGLNALSAASSSGDINIVRDIIQAGGRATGLDLFEPVKSGRLDIVHELLDAGADVNVTDRWANSLLGVAVQADHADVARTIIAAGAKLDAHSGGRTPLIIAVCNENKSLVDILLHAGAKVDARDIYGCTALMEAAIRPQKDILLRLLHAGCNPRLKSEKGDSAISLAKERKMLDNIKLLEQAAQS